MCLDYITACFAQLHSDTHPYILVHSNDALSCSCGLCWLQFCLVWTDLTCVAFHMTGAAFSSCRPAERKGLAALWLLVDRQDSRNQKGDDIDVLFFFFLYIRIRPGKYKYRYTFAQEKWISFLVHLFTYSLSYVFLYLFGYLFFSLIIRPGEICMKLMFPKQRCVFYGPNFLVLFSIGTCETGFHWTVSFIDIRAFIIGIKSDHGQKGENGT